MSMTMPVIVRGEELDLSNLNALDAERGRAVTLKDHERILSTWRAEQRRRFWAEVRRTMAWVMIAVLLLTVSTCIWWSFAGYGGAR